MSIDPRWIQYFTFGLWALAALAKGVSTLRSSRDKAAVKALAALHSGTVVGDLAERIHPTMEAEAMKHEYRLDLLLTALLLANAAVNFPSVP
jgi:hypothetical protein